jgi:RNase P protein component
MEQAFYRNNPPRRKKEMVQKVLHEPQLDTILMVENTIREAKTYPTKKQLLKSLPKQIQYQTFNRILEYLESSNKIVFDGRRIVWVFPDNLKLRELLESSVKLG